MCGGRAVLVLGGTLTLGMLSAFYLFSYVFDASVSVSTTLCLSAVVQPWVLDLPYLIGGVFELISSRFTISGKVFDWYDVTSHVYPLEIDFWGHMNNARYFRKMEYGRYHCLKGSGVGPAMRRQNIHAGFSSVVCRYRRELTIGQAIVIRTRFCGYDHTSFYFEQKIQDRSTGFVHSWGIGRYKLSRKATTRPCDVVRQLQGKESDMPDWATDTMHGRPSDDNVYDLPDTLIPDFLAHYIAFEDASSTLLRPHLS